MLNHFITDTKIPFTLPSAMSILFGLTVVWLEPRVQKLWGYNRRVFSQRNDNVVQNNRFSNDSLDICKVSSAKDIEQGRESFLKDSESMLNSNSSLLVGNVEFSLLVIFNLICP